MSLVDRLEDECMLRRPSYHFYPSYGLTSGKSNRKGPKVIRRKWLGTYLVVLETFEAGRFTVKVLDEMAGYDKVVASASGLNEIEAEKVWEAAVGVVKEELR